MEEDTSNPPGKRINEPTVSPVAVLKDLPDDIAVRVGRIAHAHALLEYILKLCIYELAGVSPTVGRIAIGTGRNKDQIRKIEDLLTYHRYMEGNFSFTDLMNKGEEVALDRDKVVHGLWAENPDKEKGVLLQDTSGRWDTGSKTPRLSRRMYPKGIPMDAEQLDILLNKIRSLIMTFSQILAELPALPRRSREPILWNDQTQNQNENKSPDQPPPSQE